MKNDGRFPFSSSSVKRRLAHAAVLIDMGDFTTAHATLNSINDRDLDDEDDAYQLRKFRAFLAHSAQSTQFDEVRAERQNFEAAVQAATERQRARLFRNLFTAISLIIVTVPALFILVDMFSSKETADLGWPGAIAALAAVSTSLAALIVSFLSQRAGVLEPLQRLVGSIGRAASVLTRTPQNSEPREEPAQPASRKEVTALQAQIDSLKEAKRVWSDAAQKQLLEEIKSDLQRGAGEKLLKDLVEEQRHRNGSQFFTSAVSSAFNEVRQRLQGELESLGRSAVVNLAVGSVLTLIALLLLGIFVFGNQELPPEPEKLTLHVVARIGLVVALEAFALFFLRLYKQCLAEIKHYHNELTNMEMRSLGTLLVTQDDMTEGQQQASSSLLTTERNFVLRKGETTTEIEKHRIDLGFDRLALKEGASIVRSATSNVVR